MHIKTAAKSLVFRTDGKVLLLTRSLVDTHAPGRLDFPGGGVWLGEDMAAAASRELQEETGLHVDPSKFTLLQTHSVIDRHGDLINRLLFMTMYPEREIHLSHAHTAYEWAELDEAIERFEHFFYNPAMKLVRDHQLYRSTTQHIS